MERLTSKEVEAVRHIRNWIAHRGRTPSIRELMGAMGYRSPRSAQDVLERLAEKGLIKKFEDGGYQLVRNPNLGRAHKQTVEVPVIGSVAAGTPILAEENIEGFVSISTSLAKRGGNYFLLRVRGDSMDEAGINDGDFVLVRQQAVAETGDRVVALIDDEATVKEFHPQDDVVVLKPRSSNPKNKPIILDHDFQIQGIVVAAVPNFE
jgi:repressor LexA